MHSSRPAKHRATDTLTWGCGVTAFFFLLAGTVLAHEKWFHKGAWGLSDWLTLTRLPTAGLIAGVVGLTVLAAVIRHRLAKPSLLPGPVAFGADPDDVARFYSWGPVILGIHVALPLLVCGVQGYLFAPYLHLQGAWQYWLGLVQVGVAIALFYGALTRLAAVAMAMAWLIGIGVFGFEPMLENSHYVGFAAFFFLAGRGPLSVDRLLLPRLQPPDQLRRLAPTALRVGVGLGLVTVAFTEKLANPALAASFLQQYPLNFTAALGIPMTDATFVLCAGAVELLVGLFVLFGLFPRLIILVAWLPFNLTLTVFDWVELIGHLPFYGAMAFLLVWAPEDSNLWIEGLKGKRYARVMRKPTQLSDSDSSS